VRRTCKQKLDSLGYTEAAQKGLLKKTEKKPENRLYRLKAPYLLKKLVRFPERKMRMRRKSLKESFLLFKRWSCEGQKKVLALARACKKHQKILLAKWNAR
jgi:hypothetical protein